mgnify:CR=1 FL=1
MDSFINEKEDNADEEPTGDGEEGQTAGEGGEQQPKEKKPKTRKTKVVTIEKNPDNISLKTFDLEFAVDPLFR